MEEYIAQYGGAIAVFAYIIVSWWRSRNDAKSVMAQQIEVMSVSLTSQTTTLISTTQRLDVVEKERSAEREAANVTRIQLQNRIEKLEDDQRLASGTITDLKRQIEVLQQEGRTKDGLLEQLRKRVNTLEKENCTLAAEKDKLEVRLTDMQRALVTSEQRAEMQAQQIEELKKRGTGPLVETPRNASAPQPADSANPHEPEPGTEGTEG